MDKHILRRIVLESYSKEELDKGRVLKIANNLNRRQLKEYIKALKNEENKRYVDVTLPYKPSDKEEETIKNLFPKKKINFFQKPSMIAGIEVRNEDEIFSLSLEDELDNILEHIAQDL